jgi:hypothetical protein
MKQQMNAAEAWGGQRPELSPHSCEKISREAIHGEATSLLIIHSETNGEPKEARIWIADKNGLPLKSEAHLSDGKTVTRHLQIQRHASARRSEMNARTPPVWRASFKMNGAAFNIAVNQNCDTLNRVQSAPP